MLKNVSARRWLIMTVLFAVSLMDGSSSEMHGSILRCYSEGRLYLQVVQCFRLVSR